MPVIEQKTTNKNKVDFDLNRLDKSKTTIFSKYPKYDVIDRYYKGQDIALVDLDFLAKVCYVLDCTVEDLLQYEGPDQ